MTSSVDIVGSPQSAPQQKAASPAAPAPSNPPVTDTNTASKSLNGRDPNAPISPRIIVDPLAGVITQFLSTSGQLQSQIPSAAVVAYLRAGLTSAGFAKPIPGAQSSNNSPAAQTRAQSGTDNAIFA